MDMTEPRNWRDGFVSAQAALAARQAIVMTACQNCASQNRDIP
jgi:hypothetical protein